MKIIIIAISFLFPVFAFAGFPKAGTTAAPFLKIGVGARAVALGGNFVALANDANALYWNPAGIANINNISFSATHTEWFAGITHGAVQFAVPMSENFAIGFDVLYLSSGNIEQTTLEQQNGNGIFYDASDFALGVTYARKLTNRFTVGVKAKFIQQRIFNEEASTFAVDFGTMYKTDFNGLRIGMNLANFGGSMQMSGNDLLLVGEDPATGNAFDMELKTESWPLPILFRVGVAIDVMNREEGFLQNDENRITLAIDGNHPNDNEETIGMGIEYEWQEMFALRMGYKGNHDVENFSFGGGFKLMLAGILFNIDYAYADFGDLESVQRFSAGFAF